MADKNIAIVLPSGGTRNAEVPDDVIIKELLPELATTLELPTVGPDGRPISYRLDSKALGRELKEDETLSSAAIPDNDRLMITADITAGCLCALHFSGSPIQVSMPELSLNWRFLLRRRPICAFVLMLEVIWTTKLVVGW
jgi:hypothetical protein